MQEVNLDINAEKKVFMADVTNKIYPKVDIIIPSLGEYGRVISLVRSIFSLVRNIDYNIIVVFDGKDSGTLKQLFKDTKRIRIETMNKTCGFGAVVNYGVKLSTSELCCVIHNDVKINEPNFLMNLVKDIFSLKKDKVVAISSTTNNPMSKKLDVLKASKAIDSAPTIVKDTSLPFICTLFYKKAFDMVKGLPEYPYCWFECDLFAAKISKLDMKEAVSHRSYVEHEGGVTILKLLNKNPVVKQVVSENLKRFKEDKNKI